MAAYCLGLGFWVNSQRKPVRIDANCNNGAPVGPVDRGRLQAWERDTRETWERDTRDTITE